MATDIRLKDELLRIQQEKIDAIDRAVLPEGAAKL